MPKREDQGRRGQGFYVHLQAAGLLFQEGPRAGSAFLVKREGLQALIRTLKSPSGKCGT